MMVRVGTKSGVGLEPHKILGQVDVRTQAGEAQIYEFRGILKTSLRMSLALNQNFQD